MRARVRRRGDEQLLPEPALDVRATRHRLASSQFGRFLAVSVAALGFTTPVSFGANRLRTFSHR
jgi:hypothetical protein